MTAFLNVVWSGQVRPFSIGKLAYLFSMDKKFQILVQYFIAISDYHFFFFYLPE